MELFEQVNINNIIMLNESDVNFLHNFGLYLFNSYDGRFDDEIKEATRRSYLFKVLNQQSINALEGIKETYIPNKILSEGLKDTYLVRSYVDPNKELKEEYSQRRFIDQNIVLYTPLVLEWLKNYARKCQDSAKTKNVLRCVYYPIKESAKNRLLILKGMGI
jgi:hypothetical protein